MLDFIFEYFSNYKTTSSEEGTLIEILNPFCEENIRVEYVPGDEFTPFIVCFAFQHCHIKDEENVIKYINDIICGNKLSIEFFRNGVRCFGGDIEAKEIKDLSYENLEKYCRRFGLSNLRELADSFKVRGWRSDDNFDKLLP